MPAFFLSIAERTLFARERDSYVRDRQLIEQRLRSVIDDILESHNTARGTVGEFKVQPDGRLEFVYGNQVPDAPAEGPTPSAP